MEGMYAHLHSYRDTGYQEGGDESIKFETAFVAPGKMYFRYSAGGDTDYFCAPGVMGFPAAQPEIGMQAATRPTWMATASINGKAEKNSLELEIAGFTGISRSTAYNVPTMLFPSYAGRRFDELTNPVVAGTQRVNGVECMIVDGKESKLWIGKQNLALYKVKDKDIDNSMTVYKPELNPKISDKVFVFRQP